MLRALTYEPVAVGTCPQCGAHDNLRFCFMGTVDEDVLMCVECAKRITEMMNDDARTP